MPRSKKYLIGTKVIYNPPYPVHYTDAEYRHKIGTIVGGQKSIGATFPQCEFPDGKLISTAWESLTLLNKNTQLLFDFMDDS